MTKTELENKIKQLWKIVDELEENFKKDFPLSAKRKFTLDGHLVGSIGDMYAAKEYGLELLGQEEPKHDAKTKDGKLYQIKTTQRDKIEIREMPDHLIVLKLNQPNANFEKVYNGDGATVWNIVGKPNKRNVYTIQLNKLRNLKK